MQTKRQKKNREPKMKAMCITEEYILSFHLWVPGIKLVPVFLLL